jgi:hypothetical protein
MPALAQNPSEGSRLTPEEYIKANYEPQLEDRNPCNPCYIDEFSTCAELFRAELDSWKCLWGPHKSPHTPGFSARLPWLRANVVRPN